MPPVGDLLDPIRDVIERQPADVAPWLCRDQNGNYRKRRPGESVDECKPVLVARPRDAKMFVMLALVALVLWKRRR